jgi:hypothetical protein
LACREGRAGETSTGGSGPWQKSHVASPTSVGRPHAGQELGLTGMPIVLRADHFAGARLERARRESCGGGWDPIGALPITTAVNPAGGMRHEGAQKHQVQLGWMRTRASE